MDMTTQDFDPCDLADEMLRLLHSRGLTPEEAAMVLTIGLASLVMPTQENRETVVRNLRRVMARMDGPRVLN